VEIALSENLWKRARLFSSIRDKIAGISTEIAPHSPGAAFVFTIVAIPMVIVHMVQTYGLILPSGQFRSFHLNLSLVILLIAMIGRTPPANFWRKAGLGFLAIVAFYPLFYIQLEYHDLVDERPFLPNSHDLAVIAIMITVTLFVAVREWGKVIPLVAFVGIIYGYFGYLLPDGLFAHGGMRVERLLGYLGIPYFRGLLGNLTEVSAGTIFMFLVFAGLIKATGGLDYVMKVAFSIGGRSRSGPAQAAVISSGFMGMISGSIMANVASTGAFTIPLMKRVGFKGSFAGAVEAVASALGQFTPPKMGLAAFLIVGLTGIPYNEVMIAAIFPSVVVYLYLAIAVHVRALKVGIHAGRIAESERAQLPLADMSLWEATLEFGHLFISLAVLVYFLLIGYAAGTAALFGIMLLMATETLKQLLRHRGNLFEGISEAVRINMIGLAGGARSGALVAVVIATISIMVEMLIVTGFAQKLSHLLLLWTEKSLWVALLITAGTSLAFGLGLPTSAAYILVAILGAPALVELGIPLLAAHLFVFYMAIMSALTPPVATAVLVASSIARADFFATGFTAVRLGLPGFLLPFYFVLRPEMLLLKGTLLDTLVATIVALIGVITLNFALEGYCLRRLSWWERFLMIPAGAAILEPSWLTTYIGLGLFAALIVFQIIRLRQDNSEIEIPTTTETEAGG
jgi:TRAP transporter 4TM/12TM fusion protein